MTRDSDEQLARYLLGNVPDDEAERLDERGITDRDFALRLRELENDLVDRCARGEPLDVPLHDVTRAQRASPYLREKIRVAAALQAAATPDSGRRYARERSLSRRVTWPALAAAAVVLLTIAGSLGLRATRLRDALGRLEARHSLVEQQNLELRQELARLRAAPAPRRQPVTATFLLPPPRRGPTSDAMAIAVPRATEEVALRLQTEADVYSTFWAALRDPTINRIVWRSRDLPGEPSGGDRIVTFTVPAGSLLAQRYSIELSGVASGGSTELIGYYPVRIVLE